MDGRLIDPARTACLCDVGDHDYAATVAVDHDGNETYWLIHKELLGEDGVDHGNEQPPHEQLGPLPLDYVRRITISRRRYTRCGRRTQAGTPCKIRVDRPGQACGWHRGTDP
jgi:hypothetical protein